MTSVITLMLILLSQSTRTALLDLYLQASEFIQQGKVQESTVLLEEIFVRMPDNNRALYNYGITKFVNGNSLEADSIFSIFPESSINSDTLLEARSSSRLANGMINQDYAAVESVIEMLIPQTSTGLSSDRIRQNYEVALKWLIQNEPPPEDNQNDQQDENNEDQEESEDNEDQEESEDNEDQEESENNEDQEEPEDNEDQEDQEEPENNEDQEEPEDNEDPQEQDQPPPPSDPEMTPEVAQMILDMVDEAEADTTGSYGTSGIGVPNW